jgi:hypothetical protein
VEETAHLVRPAELLLLVRKRLVIFLRDEVATLENHEAAVVVTARVQIDKALDAAEAGAERVLVLVRPRLDGREVAAVRERDVDSVKGNEEVLGAKELFEDLDDTGLRAHSPREALHT